MIAALYVETGGVYYGIPDVDPWDEERDARLYAGPWPVVAHPPCASWSAWAAMREVVYGKRRGEDGGCFAHALDCVRRFGGVLRTRNAHRAPLYRWASRARTTRHRPFHTPLRTDGLVNATLYLT